MFWIWFSYILGAALALISKLWRMKRDICNWKHTLIEFFFLNKKSTTTTFTVIGVYFVICYWYTSQDIIPIHWSWAFLLGTLGEIIAPYFVKRIVDKVVIAVVGSNVSSNTSIDTRKWK